MSTTISPLRRITVTLALAGAAAFSAVAIAPSAFAADSTIPAATDSAAPAVSDPAVTAPVVTPPAAPAVTDPAVTAPVVTPPAAPAVTDPAVVTPPVPSGPPIVYDKNGKPLKAPKTCTDKDLADSAKKVADATKKAAPLLSQAASLHNAANFLKAQETNMTTVAQKNLAELVVKALDSAGDKLAAQAQASIDKAGVLDCWIVSVPGGRF
jgi:hypothetical protein